jgi:hypothetical protein
MRKLIFRLVRVPPSLRPDKSFFLIQQIMMPCHKSKRATTYRQHPNALSALDISTMMSYQCFQTLCAISLVRSHCMLMLSTVFDKDDDDNDIFLTLYRHHLSILCNNLFFFNNTSLVEVFGLISKTFISRVYKILHGNCLQHWVYLLPKFMEAIKKNLNRPQYGKLLFGNVCIVGFLDCKVDEMCTLGTGLLTNEELAPRCPCAEILQGLMYSR